MTDEKKSAANGQVDALNQLEVEARAELEHLFAWRDEAVKIHIQPLDQQIRLREEQLKLIGELRATMAGIGGIAKAAGAERRNLLAVQTVSPPAVPRYAGSSVRERVRSRVREILAGRDEPMHINDIHDEYMKRGWPVPGLGKTVNLSVHLPGAADIYSPKRGYYALGSPEALPMVSTPRKQSRPRKKATRRRRAASTQ